MNRVILEFSQKLPPAFYWHIQIKKNQIWQIALIFQQLSNLLVILRCGKSHRAICFLQSKPEEKTIVLVVIYQKKIFDLAIQALALINFSAACAGINFPHPEIKQHL